MGSHLPFSLPSAIRWDGRPSPLEATLKTQRLVLRALARNDAPEVQRLCNNWAVARMTSRIPHPYPDGLAEDWIAGLHDKEPDDSSAHFALEHDSALIGIVGLEWRRSGSFEIGYWIGEPWWGRGLASEAAACVVAFAFEQLGVDELVAGHFVDNPASGRVLEKCGFRYSGEETEWSKARNSEVACRRFVLKRAWMQTAQR